MFWAHLMQMHTNKLPGDPSATLNNKATVPGWKNGALRKERLQDLAADITSACCFVELTQICLSILLRC